MAIRQAPLEQVALIAPGYESMVNGWAASGEKRMLSRTPLSASRARANR